MEILFILVGIMVISTLMACVVILLMCLLSKNFRQAFIQDIKHY